MKGIENSFLAVVIICSALPGAANCQSKSDGSNENWKSFVSQAILEGRCEDARDISIRNNDFNLAEQSQRICDERKIDLDKYKRDSKDNVIIKSEIIEPQKVPYDGRNALGVKENTIPLYMNSSISGAKITAIIYAQTFWLSNPEVDRPPLIRECVTPCKIDIPVGHMFKLRWNLPEGTRLLENPNPPIWKNRLFGSPIISPDTLELKISRQ